MFSLFSRAMKQLNLSPAERALLKLIEGFIVAGGVAVAPIVAQLLNNPAAPIDWPSEIRLIIGVFAVAVLMAASKYYKAHLDEPLSAVFSLAATNVAEKAGVTSPVASIAPPIAAVALPTASPAPQPAPIAPAIAPSPVAPPDGPMSATIAPNVPISSVISAIPGVNATNNLPIIPAQLNVTGGGSFMSANS